MEQSIMEITPHYLKEMEILTIVPEYDNDDRFTSLVVIGEHGEHVRIIPMLDLSTEIPYLELKDIRKGDS